jgi:hypothetical protein
VKQARSPSKKAVPWLRRLEKAREVAGLSDKYPTQLEEGSPSPTDSTCSTCATTVIDFDVTPKREPSVKKPERMHALCPSVYHVLTICSIAAPASPEVHEYRKV